jgi:hypothetical protein
MPRAGSGRALHDASHDDSGSAQGRKATFCEQKVAKKLCYAGPEAVSLATPMAQHNKSFCAAFFKKRLLC